MEDKIKKVLIMGLDNSGKTSIVLCLKGVKNLLSFYSLNPTKGISINKFRALDSNFNIWDFGGQEQFRGDYLKNFNKHIVGTNKIIYVIDVQDIERYELSLNYLKSIINLLICPRSKEMKIIDATEVHISGIIGLWREFIEYHIRDYAKRRDH